MLSVKQVVRVQPGHRVEIVAPEFAEGDLVDVVVQSSEPSVRHGSVLSFIDSLPDGPRAFATWDEYEQHLRQEARVMVAAALPTTGLIYVDANVVIYTVEKHPRYSPALRPLWSAVAADQRVIVSELILLETLVGPYRAKDSQLAADYETFLRLPGVELVPISPSILREAARLRSQWPRLRSPDAIHAATAFSRSAVCLLTNDFGFRNISGLIVTVLDEILDSAAAP